MFRATGRKHTDAHEHVYTRRLEIAIMCLCNTNSQKRVRRDILDMKMNLLINKNFKTCCLSKEDMGEASWKVPANFKAV